MQLFDKTSQINFMDKRGIALILSLVLLLAGATSLTLRGLNLGLDFTGGTLVEVGYEQAPMLDDVRLALEDAGFEDSVVQFFGGASDILVRLAPREVEGESSELVGNAVLEALQDKSTSDIEMRRVEYVGPQIGKELAEQGGLAMLWVLAGILIYVSLRFQWRFSLGAVAALVHDVVATVGILSILQIPFDLTVVAALLAVLGYSLNDTIVVFDRIRENFLGMRKSAPKEVINTSVNQTLARTIITSGTTLLVLLALFFLGGEIIHAFAFTLIIGIFVGTYSSIFIASSAVLSLRVSREDLLEVKVEKEGANLESIQ